MTITPAVISELVEIRRGDTQRVFYDQLLLGSQPIDLTNQTVSLVIYDPINSTVVRRDATVTSAVSGSVQYQFVDEDVAVTGSRLLEWEIVNENGKELTIPTTKYIKLNILPDLG